MGDFSVLTCARDLMEILLSGPGISKQRFASPGSLGNLSDFYMRAISDLGLVFSLNSSINE